MAWKVDIAAAWLKIKSKEEKIKAVSVTDIVIDVTDIDSLSQRMIDSHLRSTNKNVTGCFLWLVCWKTGFRLTRLIWKTLKTSTTTFAEQPGPYQSFWWGSPHPHPKVRPRLNTQVSPLPSEPPVDDQLLKNHSNEETKQNITPFLASVLYIINSQLGIQMYSCFCSPIYMRT